MNCDWIEALKCSVAALGLGTVLLVVAIFAGCLGPEGRLGTIDHNRLDAEVSVSPEVNAAWLSTRIEALEAKVTGIQTGDVTIGGQGDSITSWLREVIWGLLWLAAIVYYPLVHRPIRKAVERQRASEY